MTLIKKALLSCLAIFYFFFGIFYLFFLIFNFCKISVICVYFYF